MARRGFLTSSCYLGWVVDRWQRFPTEADYHAYMDELESGAL